MASCGERAAALLAAACKDTDALLPLPLPHTRALKQRPQRTWFLTPVVPLHCSMKLAVYACHKAVHRPLADSVLVHVTMLCMAEALP